MSDIRAGQWVTVVKLIDQDGYPAGSSALVGRTGKVIAPADERGLVFVRLNGMEADAAWELFWPEELAVQPTAAATPERGGT